MGPQAMQSLDRRLWERKGARAQEWALDSDALAWVLAALAQYFRIPFDARLLLGQFPPPHGFETVVSAAAAIGLRAGWKARTAASLNRIGAPFIAVLAPKVLEPHPGIGATRDFASLAPEAPDQRLAFILRMEEGRVAFFEQGEAGHTILPFAEFAARYAGQVLLVTPEPKALQDRDAQDAARVPFGFRWFVPELLKHRKVFQDVLLASLAIQLMALATPLFSQVVIENRRFSECFSEG